MLLLCCCYVVVMVLLCCCCVVVVLLLCCCYVVVMLLFCCCYVVVMLLLWCCYVVVMLLLCCCCYVVVVMVLLLLLLLLFFVVFTIVVVIIMIIIAMLILTIVITIAIYSGTLYAIKLFPSYTGPRDNLQVQLEFARQSHRSVRWHSSMADAWTLGWEEWWEETSRHKIQAVKFDPTFNWFSCWNLFHAGTTSTKLCPLALPKYLAIPRKSWRAVAFRLAFPKGLHPTLSNEKIPYPSWKARFGTVVSPRPEEDVADVVVIAVQDGLI